MKCYTHQESDAVGICKSCYKGICIDCAVELHNGIACKNSCEERVKSLNLLIETNKRLVPSAEKLYYGKSAWLLSLFFILTGLVFLMSGVTFSSEGISISNEISAILGALFVLFGGIRGLQTVSANKRKLDDE